MTAAAPMEGDGAYNRNSSWQTSLNRPVIEVFAAAAEAAPLDGEGPLVVADYGCSQGVNSLAPIGAALAVLRRRAGPDRPISVLHNDLPGNDFATLFQTLHEHPASYLASVAHVFPSAVGCSFYKPVAAPGSVTLGWSANSAHWLSNPLPPLPDTWMPPTTRDSASREHAQRAAAADWRTFLSNRARELRTGGRMVVTLVAKPLDESVFERWGRNARRLPDALLEKGVVTPEESARIVAPFWNRTREEVVEPFGQDGVFAELKLEALAIEERPDPFWLKFQETGDAAEFGRMWGATLRVTIGPSLASTLAPERRSAFLAAYATEIASDAEKDLAPWTSYWATVVLSKT
jgi:hypothetical protein